MTRRRTTHILILTLLCAWMYALRPDAIGLVSTQEAFRALAARNMQASGDLVVPTLDGDTPYLQKPPMMYWIAIAIAEVRGAEVSAVDVRLTSALGGIAGVLATYFGALVILRRRDGPDPDDDNDHPLLEDAAWLSALGLATGLLYVRSARTAELDILMIAPIVIAIAAIARAWRAAGDTSQPIPPAAYLRPAPNARLRWACITIASLAAAFAALVKGLPVLVIAIAAYGAMIVDAVLTPRDTPRAWRIAARIGAVLTALALATISTINAEERAPVGVLTFFTIGLALGWGIVRACEPRALRTWITAWSRTHPAVVLGAGALTYLAWVALVKDRVGEEVVREIAAIETGNNLNLLVPRSPFKNLGFMAYGLLPMGIASVLALWNLVRERPALAPTQRIPAAWTGLGFVLFSAFGKGVARYLTPIWPAFAMVGGFWLARTLRDAPRDIAQARAWRTIVTTTFIATAIAQGAYYAFVRPTLEAHRSARGLVHELIASHKLDPAHLATFRFTSPMLDYYARRPIPMWDGIAPLPIAEWVMVEREQRDAAEAALHRHGLVAVEAQTDAAWHSRDEPILVFRISR